MDYTKKVIYQSNYWYNDGLSKANIRDLSGAITSLRRSLQYNRDNVAARNLLGLVYYGRGEVVEALVEWVLSKNIQKDDNIAGYFIKKMQEDPQKLKTVNQAIKKYNQSLDLANQNSEDLAVIQLKQAVKEHPDFVKAHQLLALLYMDAEDLRGAARHVRIARSIDKTDETTLRYAHELDEAKKEHNAQILPGKTNGKKNGTITYNVGNDTIIQPAPSTFKEGNGRYTILNIVIGAALGIAVMMFLIMPASLAQKQKELNKETLEFSDRIAVQEAQISALKKELEGYKNAEEPKEEEKDTETADSVRSYYESVYSIYSHWQDADMSDADILAEMLKVNASALGPTAKGMFDEISADVYPRMEEKLAQSGKDSYDSGDFEAAITAFSQVVQMDGGYDDAGIYYLLGDSYKQSGNTDQAKAAYQAIIDNYPGTGGSEDATAALEGMNE